MVVRMALLLVVLLAAFLAVGIAERWRGRTGSVAVPVGLTLVSSPGCRDCVVAKERFDRLGVPYREVGLDVAASLGLRTFTMPMAIVGSPAGDLVMVRRGSAVAADAEALMAASV
jgi:Glutaredoxin